jgi:hypothetical protein
MLRRVRYTRSPLPPHFEEDNLLRRLSSSKCGGRGELGKEIFMERDPFSFIFWSEAPKINEKESRFYLLAAALAVPT